MGVVCEPLAMELATLFLLSAIDAMETKSGMRNRSRALAGLQDNRRVKPLEPSCRQIHHVLTLTPSLTSLSSEHELFASMSNFMGEPCWANRLASIWHGIAWPVNTWQWHGMAVYNFQRTRHGVVWQWHGPRGYDMA